MGSPGSSIIAAVGPLMAAARTLSQHPILSSASCSRSLDEAVLMLIRIRDEAQPHLDVLSSCNHEDPRTQQRLRKCGEWITRLLDLFGMKLQYLMLQGLENTNRPPPSTGDHNHRDELEDCDDGDNDGGDVHQTYDDEEEDDDYYDDYDEGESRNAVPVKVFDQLMKSGCEGRDLCPVEAFEPRTILLGHEHCGSCDEGRIPRLVFVVQR